MLEDICIHARDLPIPEVIKYIFKSPAHLLIFFSRSFLLMCAFNYISKHDLLSKFHSKLHSLIDKLPSLSPQTYYSLMFCTWIYFWYDVLDHHLIWAFFPAYLCMRVSKLSKYASAEKFD